MKILLAFLLVAASCYCYAQTDTNLIAAGDWSKPVSAGGIAIRGRLLVYDDQAGDAYNLARIYLELQRIPNHPDVGYITEGRVDATEVEIYYDPNMGWDNEPSGLRLELRDENHQKIPSEGPLTFNGAFTPPYWIILTPDMTVRFRSERLSIGKPKGLTIMGRVGQWTIPPNATNDYYLHGSFVSTTNHPSPIHYHIWQGTLELPPVKIPAKK
jgi:hypothetical protein